MTKMSSNNKLSLVLANFASKPAILIQSFEGLGGNDYGVIFTNSLTNKFGFEQFDNAFAELTAGSLSIEPESLILVDEAAKLYRCIARENVESVPYTPEKVAELGLKAIGTSVKANMFLEDDDTTIWKLEGEGDAKRLVRVTKQNYDSLLQAKKSRSPVLSSFDDVSPFHVGDYAYFFNTEVKAMDFGYVVERDNREYAFSRKTLQLHEIKAPGQVIIAHEPRERSMNPLNKKQEMALAGEYSLEGYLAYLKLLYGDSNPYFKAIERNVREFTLR